MHPGQPRAFKDGYASLDLRPHGYAPMFDARWLQRSPRSMADERSAGAAERLRWQLVDSAALLGAWEAAWWPEPALPRRPGMVYGVRLLDNAAVRLLAALDDAGRVVAGAAVTDAAGVLGLSALFGGAAAETTWRQAVIAEIGRRWPGRVLVGYEHGDDLVAMRACGFDDIGPLRVWWRQASGGKIA